MMLGFIMVLKCRVCGKRFESRGFRWKTKTPPAGEAGGVLEKIDDLNQIVNYLPASLSWDWPAFSGLRFGNMAVVMAAHAREPTHTGRILGRL